MINTRRKIFGGALALAGLPFLLAFRNAAVAGTQAASKAKVKLLNPWKWQDAHGFSQGALLPAGAAIFACAGQTSVDANGSPLHPGDMEKQVLTALENLETVLRAGGATLSDVIKLNYYVTDIQAFFTAQPALNKRLAEFDCKPTSTLLGVAALFHPDIMFEIEATAIVPDTNS